MGYESIAHEAKGRMGYESIAHEAKGRMGYWFRGYEGERNNCFCKIQLVGLVFTAKTLQIWGVLFATSGL